MERIEMSQEERDRLEWLKRAKDGVISQREAAERIGVSERWVRKVLRGYNHVVGQFTDVIFPSVSYVSPRILSGPSMRRPVGVKRKCQR